MKLKLFLLFILLGPLCYAQRNVYFLKYSGGYVDKLDSADYIRVVTLPDSGSVLYNIAEFYKGGQKRTIGKSSSIDPPRYEGQRLSFYESGKRRGIANYALNNKAGTQFDFYSNGRVYLQTQYPDSGKRDSQFRDDYLITACYDSLGKSLVANGFGYYIGYDTKFTYVEEQGPVKNGKRDSIWTGMHKAPDFTFTEVYKDGELINGSSIDKAGVSISYSKNRSSAPQFTGGDAGFGKYLANNLRYPDYQRDNNIQGTVVLQFTVEKDGKVSNVKVNKSVDRGLDAEAVRVLKRSPSWIPGTLAGRPVRVEYSVPVSFSLR